MRGETGALQQVRTELQAHVTRFDFGEATGAATTVKLAGNFLIISAAAMTEALALAANTGVDPRAAIGMLTSTLSTAPTYQGYGRRIADGTATMNQSAIPAKDLGLFRRTAAAAPAPITNLLPKLRER